MATRPAQPHLVDARVIGEHPQDGVLHRRNDAADFVMEDRY
ncbi:hypothetical protein J2S30_002900 [Herbaspirillum rubrisubalbicans]|nr:hypothetical protein [Herbaspirillum rubrisubalbicans]